MSNFAIIVGIGAFIVMIWVIRRAESCFGVLINIVLIGAAAIAVILLLSLVRKNFGF